MDEWATGLNGKDPLEIITLKAGVWEAGSAVLCISDRVKQEIGGG